MAERFAEALAKLLERWPERFAFSPRYFSDLSDLPRPSPRYFSDGLSDFEALAKVLERIAEAPPNLSDGLSDLPRPSPRYLSDGPSDSVLECRIERLYAEQLEHPLIRFCAVHIASDCTVSANGEQGMLCSRFRARLYKRPTFTYSCFIPAASNGQAHSR